MQRSVLGEIKQSACYIDDSTAAFVIITTHLLISQKF